MPRLVIIVALLTGLFGLGSSAVAETRAFISFADLGGVRDWRPDGNDALFIEGQNRKWYRATFFGPCHGLRFAETIAFITEPDGSLNKFSSLWVDGQRCHFKSFNSVDGPGKEDLYEVEDAD